MSKAAYPAKLTDSSATRDVEQKERNRLNQAQTNLQVPTQTRGLIEITDRIDAWVRDQPITTGLLSIFIQHTSASLTIQENADPDVLHDLNVFFGRLVKEDASLYRHTAEGPDDMPAHIRSALTDVSLTIPVAAGRPVLGTWQGIYVFEHRSHPHNRLLSLHLIGE